jgi:predicted ATPase
VVALTGEGGMGKTTVAAAAAHATRAGGSAVVWVNCERAGTFEECVHEAAAVLFGDRCQSDPVEQLSDRVAEQLARRAALLVLDTFEAVAHIRSIDWVAKLRAPARVLVTARELPSGLASHVITVRELSRADAVALFFARTAKAGRLDRPPEDVVNDLCEQVGDHPLAVRLLAVYAARMPVRDLLAAVRRSVGFLHGRTSVNSLARHNGIAACF